MGTEQLTAIKGGIDRQRTKGGALKDKLYDLLNGYVEKGRTVVVRPGTMRNAYVPNTKGLCSFDGSKHVFAAETVTVPDGYTLHVLTRPGDGVVTTPINRIYFAKPFMGFLYVVADFVGDTNTYYHFWLQTGSEWQANRTYKHGDIVAPSTANGFAYQASRIGSPNLAWAPGVQRALNDVIEPTEYNDFYYTAVDVLGTNPRSGDEEPVWPTEGGAQVAEDADGIGGAAAGTPTEAPDNTETPNPDTTDRYEGGV